MRHHISSLQNPLIKKAVQLKYKARERKDQGLFIAEGLRELGLALQNGYEALALFYDPELTKPETIENLLAKAKIPPAEIITLTTKVLDKIAYRSSVPNAVAIFKNKNETPIIVRFDEGGISKKVPLVLVLEGIEKPGNLGAILRTADAAGVTEVIVCEPKFDLFNPNAIRASLGAIFSLEVFEMSSEAALAFLKKQQIKIFATWLEAARPLYECDLKNPTALVLGAEATGITSFWVEQADRRIIIPMSGQVDSLNVSTSAAIVLFEAVRQRIIS